MAIDLNKISVEEVNDLMLTDDAELYNLLNQECAGKPLCPHNRDGLFCTRAHGHAGIHMAQGTEHVLLAWKQGSSVRKHAYVNQTTLIK